jgi:hypothetical protein
MYFRADGVDNGGCETGCPLTLPYPSTHPSGSSRIWGLRQPCLDGGVVVGNAAGYPGVFRVTRTPTCGNPHPWSQVWVFHGFSHGFSKTKPVQGWDVGSKLSTVIIYDNIYNIPVGSVNVV